MITRTWKVRIHTNQHRFSFTEECRLHSVASPMSWQQSSSLTSFVHIHLKEPNQSVATECEQLANAYSKELSFRTVLSSHKLSSNQDVLQKWNQPQAPRKPFRLPVLNHLLASVFKWCKHLRRDPHKGKKNETKWICFNTDLSKVWSTTYQSPSLHTAFLSNWNPGIYTYLPIYIYIYIYIYI